MTLHKNTVEHTNTNIATKNNFSISNEWLGSKHMSISSVKIPVKDVFPQKRC